MSGMFMIGIKPMSVIRASMSSSISMFEDLMFPRVNVGPPMEWIWAMPLAVPSAILTLVSQANEVLPAPVFPVVSCRLLSRDR